MGFSSRFLRAAAIAALINGSAGVAHAADCNSFVRLFSQRASTPNFVASPVAWTGTTFGIAKTDSFSVSEAIYFAVYDSEMAPLSPDRLVADSSLKGPTALLWTGSEFGLFYQTPNLQLVLQRISSVGVPIGGPIEIAKHHATATDDEFDVVWDPFRNAYAVARTIAQTSDRGVWLMIVGTDGTLRKDVVVNFFQARPAKVRVAATTTGTIGITFLRSTNNALQLVRVTSTDAVQLPQTASTTAEDARIAPRDAGFVIVSSTHDSGTGRGVMNWARVDADGKISAESTLFNAIGIDVAPVSLAWNAQRNEWALAYLSSQLGFRVFPGEYRLRRFRATGSLISDTLFSPDPLRNTASTSYPIVSTGTAYFSSIELFVSRQEGSDSYVVRHCPLTATATASTAFPRPFDTITFTATVSGGTPEFSYVWDFGDLSNLEKTPTITHRFDREGTFVVTLTVTDAAGGKSVTTTTVKVAAGKRRVGRR
ncbi:MAG TPA: PKD domain-containing protein [Thermoanaerobaculia bacterium]|nr:PKD domain-containing protein [Thermoanaerobaculia bacterium]